jgi:hypothetical protein
VTNHQPEMTSEVAAAAISKSQKQDAAFALVRESGHGMLSMQICIWTRILTTYI